MRAGGLTTDLLEIPFRTPIATSTHTWMMRRLALVRLRTRDGLEGIGEAPGVGRSSRSAAAGEELARRLEGVDLSDPTDLDRRMRGVEEWREIGRPLRAAVETAAADLAARAAGLPVAASLSRPAARQVVVSGLVGIEEPGVAAHRAAGLVAAGFRWLKLKGGGEATATLAERVRAIRTAVGPSVRLRVDVNGAWTTLAEAIEAIAAIASSDLDYVEQPLPPDAGTEALVRLRHAVSVPIAADECVADPPSAFALLEAGAVDVLVVKPAQVGGLRQAGRILARAAASGVPVVVSTLFETGIGVAAALHLASTLDEQGQAHGLATTGLLASDLLAEPLTIRDGRMAVPAGPGLGVALDATAVERFRSR